MELELTINGVSGAIELWEDEAPNATAALVRDLPLETKLKQCRWSGDACYTEMPADGALGSVSKLERPVVSMYPGTIVVRLGEMVAPDPEILIGYGSAEHRWPDGPKPVTPVGEITTGQDELFEAMSQIAKNGPAEIRLRVAEGASAQ